MNITPYRTFATMKECRFWIVNNMSNIYEGYSEPQPIAEVWACATFQGHHYRATGYSWCGPTDVCDNIDGDRIARGRAVKALTAIIWKADTARAFRLAYETEREEAKRQVLEAVTAKTADGVKRAFGLVAKEAERAVRRLLKVGVTDGR